ncbi:MAG TPA: energy transducer TonB, partial [Phenylobacterium sp.]|nr:energy transducer TonB [Phenylobacterium sp.]
MRERTDYSRAMAASVALHLAVLAILILSRGWARQLPVGTVVPVNIVSNASLTDLRAAAQAAQEQAAQTEQPVEDAPVEPAAPEPTPLPQTRPTPAPAPTPQAVARPQPKPPELKPAV